MPKKNTPASEHTTEITAMGIIVPAAWDSRGQPVSVMLATYDEKEYLVSMATVKGKQLGDLLHQKVCVTGTIDRSSKNKWLLNVEMFEMLGETVTGDGFL